MFMKKLVRLEKITDTFSKFNVKHFFLLSRKKEIEMKKKELRGRSITIRFLFFPFAMKY